MTEPTARTVTSALELLQDVGVSIEGLTFYSLSAKIGDAIGGVIPPPDDIKPTYGLSTLIEPQMLGIRLLTRIAANVGEIEVDVAITYRIAEPVDLTREVVLEFANEVGVMALLPYVREAVSNLSVRVFGNAILMPVIQRGEVHFGLEAGSVT